MRPDPTINEPSSAATIEGEAKRLREYLLQAGADLQEGRIGGLGRLVEEISTFLRSCEQWQHELAARARQCGASVPDRFPGELRDWISAHQLVEQAERRQAHALRHAVEYLDQLLRVRHSALKNFVPLEECLREAQQLRDALVQRSGESKTPAEVEALVSGEHRYRALLELIIAPADIDEAQWDALRQRVEQSFPTKLAIAAERRFLIITEGAQPLAEENTPPISPILETPISVPAQDAKFSSGPESAQVSATPTLAKSETAPETAPPVIDSSSSKPTTEETNPADFLGETGSQSDATDSTSGHSEDSSVVLPEPDATQSQMATQELEPPASEPQSQTLEALPAVVSLLLEKGLSSLAYQASWALAQRGTEGELQVPSAWLLRAIVLASHVQNDDGRLAPLLAEAFPKDAFEQRNTPSLAQTLLILAGTLRPALLAPGTFALVLLKSAVFPPRAAALRALQEQVVDYAERNAAFDIELVRMVRDQGSWEVALRGLRGEVETWLRRAPAFSTAYAPASQVWRRWVDNGGVLHVIATAIMNDQLPSAEQVRAHVRNLADEVRFRKFVNESDRKHRTGGKDIEGTALDQLRSNTEIFLELTQRWLTLVRHRNNLQTAGYRLTSAAQFVSTLTERADEVRRELDTLNQEPELSPATACCRSAIENLVSLFNPEHRLSVVEPDPAMLLNGELLRIVELELGEDWSVESSPGLILNAVARLRTADDLPSWEDAFIRRAERGDLEGTELILEYLHAQASWQADDADREETLVDELRASRAGHQKRLCLEIQGDLDRLRRDVDTTAALALLQDRGHSSYLSDIEQIEAEIKQDSFVRFRDARMRIDGMRQRLGQLRVPFRTETERSLARLRAEQPNHPTIPRIERLLQQGDLLTAREYLNAAESGQTAIGVVDERDSFAEFFPLALRTMYTAAQSKPLDAAHVRAVESRRSVFECSMEHLAPEQAKRAAGLLENWLTLKSPKLNQESAARAALHVLRELGFEVRDIQPIKRRMTGSRRLVMHVEAKPLADRSRCPVAHYGSVADGRYHLWLLWGEPSIEEWITDVGDSSQGVAQVVFWFGPLSETQRQSLSQECHSGLRTVLVVDDLLLVHLCSRQDSRLRALFECTLPFTYLKPYVVNGEPLPPEMFYGRSRERDEVQKPTGTCFIYGGRQLGKTALLHDVRYRTHDLSAGRCALYVDLRVHGIGYTHGPDRIWHKLAELLAEQKVVPAGLPSNIRGETLLRHVEEWLADSPERRILLLLDEADKFLEADSQDEFMRCAEIKGAMERTSRRFKVVFSGLHNVLRSTRQANHPLAHFGTPICIGPLFQDSEWREARALVERPLGSLGYRFESADLVMRMLSQVNFYPSLIQLYCDHLQTFMSDLRSSQKGMGPPFAITERNIDATYRNPRLKEKIRDRFRWTLQLDERYQVIAYAIAYLALGEDQRRVATGFSSADIRQVAVEHWPDGFTGQGGEDAFVVLLDELVGLGVLHTAGGGKYNLRSPNLMFLLGETEEDILSQLTRKRELPPVYTADTFRVGLGADPSKRLSPLTSRQTAEIQDGHGVVLLIGCPAAGLADVPSALQYAFGKSCVYLNDEVEYGDFARRLDGLVRQRAQDTTTLILVDQTCAYSEKWLLEASQRCSALTSKTSFLKIAFVADPKTLWTLVDPDAEGLQRLRDAGVRLVSLAPWHDEVLRHWLSDAFHSGPNDKEEREQLSAATGNWASLLDRFHKLCRSGHGTWRDALEQLRRQVSRISLEEFGLDIDEPQRVMRELADLGSATEEDLCNLITGVEPIAVQRTLRWAEALLLVRQFEQGAYRLDPLVHSLIKAAPAARTHNGR